MKKRINTFIHELLNNMKKPDMNILPGQLAFYFVLTLIPLVAVVGSIVNIMDLPTEILDNRLSIQLPNAVKTLILQISTERHLSTHLIMFMITSLVLASNGTHSMIIASNHIYKIKNKSYLNRRIKSFFMLVNLILLLVFIIVFLVFGDKIINYIWPLGDNTKLQDMIYTIYRVLKYPLSFLFIYISIKVLYTMAPDKVIKTKHVTYGALFTSITWILATRIYSLYVDRFAVYDSFYGSISSLIVLLFWIYILSYVFVLGMVLNATRYNLDNEASID